MRSRAVAPAPGAIVLFVAVLVAGCGRPVGSVSGKVTYQGKPLKGGNVSFVSTEGSRSFAAGINPDGTYRVHDVLGGSYKVCVETASMKPAAAPAPVVPRGAKGGPPPGAQVPEGYTPSDPAAMAASAANKRYTPIPPKYADPTTTDLEYTLKGGDDTHDIDLK